jgi:hypothetical protein
LALALGFAQRKVLDQEIEGERERRTERRARERVSERSGDRARSSVVASAAKGEELRAKPCRFLRDDDGAITAEDFAMWRGDFEMTSPLDIDGDANFVWRSNFGCP